VLLILYITGYYKIKDTKICIFLQYADLSVRLAGPDQLNPKPDVNKLAFGKYFTDHMLKINYYESLNGWQAPEIMPLENIVLHPAAKVLHYAVEVYITVLYFIR